jgi:hypothetical protein
MKTRNTFSRIWHHLGNGGSGFGSYFASIQSHNCHDCPDCRCEDGPSVEEARKDYLAMHKVQIPIL